MFVNKNNFMVKVGSTVRDTLFFTIIRSAISHIYIQDSFL